MVWIKMCVLFVWQPLNRNLRLIVGCFIDPGTYKSIESMGRALPEKAPTGQDDGQSSAGSICLPAASANIHLRRR